MNKQTKAILLMLFSSLCFSAMGVFVKLSGDIPTVEKTFFRNLVSCFIAGSIILYKKKPFFGSKENMPFLIARSTLGVLGVICYFYSIENLVLSDSAMLNKLSPFFVSIFAYIILKEKFTKIQAPALFCAFAGALMIIKPQFDISVFPALVGLSGAVFAGGAYIAVKFLGSREEFYTIVFFFSFFSTMVLLPFTAMNFTVPSTVQLLYLTGIGVFAALAQFSMTIAYKLAPAGEISILSYTNVIFSAVLGYVIWNETADIISIMGYSLVILSATAIYFYNRRASAQKAAA